MSRLVWMALLGCAFAIAPASHARAQGIAGEALPIYEAPGYYGMAYGSASFGSVRTYSNFSSPFGGVGYGYGYDPYALMPGPFGEGIWRPGTGSPGQANMGSYRGYRTFPVALGPETSVLGPPVGYYAPAFGPPAVYP